MTDYKRTHTCGELRAENAGETVTLTGWAATWRDHGGCIFIDLRDRYGRTQLVFRPDINEEAYKTAKQISKESSVAARGKVVDRGTNRNKKIPTGDIEVEVTEIAVLSASDTPPFEIADETNANEELRLTWRFLDLRRKPLQDALIKRHKACLAARNYLDENGFLEIETPFLTRSTPEGARDFLVPSRIEKGSFYALPQSPQIFKQLFMVAGLDRYFQIVRCFRDEDLRNDRQPEFTQIDIELSFADETIIQTLVEGLLKRIWKEVRGVDIPTPFEHIMYDDAMLKYGADAPDMRFGLLIHDVTDILRGAEFGVTKSAIEAGGVTRAIVVEGTDLSRKQLDELAEFVKAKENGGLSGLLYMKVAPDGAISGPLSKALTDEDRKNKLFMALSLKPGAIVLLGAGETDKVRMAMGKLRKKLGASMGLAKPDHYKFVWVDEFPLFELTDEGKPTSAHHPFTAPKPEDVHLLETNPIAVKARAYDVVLNGSEIGGGSVRIHDSGLQSKIFETLGLTKDEAQEKFGHLLNAFRFGPPPHAGLALGLDRLVMLLVGAESLRDVIAYPKTTRGACLMTGAPSTVDAKQLEELGVAVMKKE